VWTARSQPSHAHTSGRYPLNITTAGGGEGGAPSWTIDIFASYGVYNPATRAITSVDIDLESLDAFTKALPLKPEEHLVFVVEEATGTLLALSHPAVDTHQHDTYALARAADCEIDAVARAVAACVRTRAISSVCVSTALSSPVQSV
jgi:hypothetical protein